MTHTIIEKQAAVRPELCIFTEELIDAHPDIAMEVLGFSSKFGAPLGWHYLLDLIWILSRLPVRPPARILDAGGGYGLLQYMLATLGYAVVSVDAAARVPQPGTRNVIPVHCSGFTESPGASYVTYIDNAGASTGKILPRPRIKGGEVEFHCCNMQNLQFLETDEFDAVVSVSALEHNAPEMLPQVMGEIRRVAKADAPMLLTISTSAAQQPGLHEASHSWLLTEKQIAALYQVPAGYSSNFGEIATLAKNLAASPRLNRWLAAFYHHSGDNGMPWGRWAPQYLPMGIFMRNVNRA